VSSAAASSLTRRTKPAPKPVTKKVSATAKRHLTILHLYPQELNIYGDRGNILTLVQRLRWRGYEPEVVVAGIGQKAQIAAADIIFGGGGQDRGQVAVGHDLQRHAKALHQAAANGVPILTICGTYQLFGRDFTTLDGTIIPGISLFRARTIGSHLRMIGNSVVDTPLGQLVGFENHSGRTLLEEGQEPLGRVIQGYGNDGRSGFEGALVRNTYGTYLHGPVLPKNPHLADALIATALQNRYGITELSPLNDYLEELAASDAAKRPQ
jgi:CobQ-like glutamine amidotransferase family enzyme